MALAFFIVVLVCLNKRFGAYVRFLLGARRLLEWGALDEEETG